MSVKPYVLTTGSSTTNYERSHRYCILSPPRVEIRVIFKYEKIAFIEPKLTIFD